MAESRLENPGEAEDEPSALQRTRDWLWDLVRTWLPAILVVLLIRSVLF